MGGSTMLTRRLGMSRARRFYLLHEKLDAGASLVEGYGDAPPGLSWYLATGIVRRAALPFRYLDERWPERVEAMVEAAESALAR